jgi:hypothetical protein
MVWRALGELSTSALATIQAAARGLPAGSAIVLIDDRTRRDNLAAAFGTAIQHAVALATGRSFRVWIDPAVPNAALAGLSRPATQEVRIVLQLDEDRRLGSPKPGADGRFASGSSITG